MSRRPLRAGAMLWLCWAVFLAIEAAALRLAADIPYSDRLDQTFESGSEAYLRYREAAEMFGTGETDILILLEAPDFADPTHHDPVESFLIDLQFADGVALVLSPFSYTVTGLDGTEALLFPGGVTDPTVFADTLRAARADRPGLARLLSDDLGTMLAVVLAPDLPQDIRDRAAMLAGIRTLADASFAGTGVTATLTGYPAVRNTVIERLDEDFVVLNVVGLLAGTAVAALLLRSVVLGLAAAFCAHSARLWTVVGLGAFGFDVNPVTVALPTLLLVLALAEAVHLAVETRRCHSAGVPRPHLAALRAVWPAATLAAVTTGIAFAALMISPSALVFRLGAFGTVSVLICTGLVFAFHVLIGTTIDRTWGFSRLLWGRAVPVRRGPPSGLFAGLARHARPVAALGLCALAVSAAGYLRVTPNYTLFEGLHADEPAIRALDRIDASLGPVTVLSFAHPAHPPDRLATAAAALEALSPGHPVLGADPDLSDLPEALRDRMQSPDGGTRLLTLPYAYRDSVTARADIAALQAEIARTPALSALGPPTGAVQLSAFGSDEILRAFAWCFLIAAAASGVIVAMWMRSAVLGALAILPNLLPVTVVGAVMWLTGMPMSFNAGVALTIAFGIAVDDTVHVLNRLRIVARRTGAMTRDTVTEAMTQIAPALIVTTLVLIVGIAGTLFSAVPGLVDFGMLTIAVFCIALAADILFLPALLVVALRWLPGADSAKGA